MSTKSGSFVFRFFSVFILLPLLFSVQGITPAHAAGIRYAKQAASGTGDCSTWANACTLQTALTFAVSGDEIWVAAGTHKPIFVGTGRGNTFQLKSGVALYGGFAGTETLRTERNPVLNVTILSGDLDNNDSQTPIITNLTTVTGTTTNSYHVVTGAGGGTLDGFTITAGNANGGGVCPGDNCGGGMYNDSMKSPTLTNVIFSGNSASHSGGGMYNYYYSSPTLTNVTFENNSAGGGGGIYNEYHSNPTLTNVIFNGNYSAGNGGGMCNWDSNYPTLMNVTFSGNSADDGGGMYNYSSSPSLTNVTFSDNSATNGGGMDNFWFSTPTLTNVTFSGNSATNGGGIKISDNTTLMNVTFSGNLATNGGAIYNATGTLQISNTIFWGITAAQIYNGPYAISSVVSDSIVQGGCPVGITCTNVIATDPKLGTLANYGGFTQTIPLQTNSSAIDTGNELTCSVTDQRGVIRPQGVRCDIGSYEFDNTPPVVQTITRANLSPTNLASVNFTVAFSESVNGVDLSDFSLTTTGVSSSAVSRISGTGSVYTVTVNTGSGNGTIRLNILDDNSIIDITSNPLFSGFTGGETYTINKAATFSDVALTYWASSYIERLYNASITGGCSTVPLNYCPDSTVTRAQMAIFLLKGIHGSSYAPPAVNGNTGFGDVAADYWAAAWIKQLAAEGITSGCGGGSYCPDSTVTRAQMAIFLLKAMNGSSYAPPAVGGSTGFTDVAADYWAAAFIKQLVAEGITAGCGNGGYCPDSDVTRAQMAVFLVNTFNLP